MSDHRADTASEYLAHEEIDKILARQLTEREVVFANGQQANNHLDLGYEETDVSLRPPLVFALGILLHAAGLEQDTIVPVPTGAEGWVHHYNLGLADPQPVVRLRKVQRRSFELLDVRTALENERRPIVVVDDTTSDGGTSEAAADFMAERGFAVSAVISLFVRGEQLAPSKYPRLWVAHKPIPAKLDWKIFRQQGKIEQLTI